MAEPLESEGTAPPVSPARKKVGRFFDYLSWGVLLVLGLHFLTRETGGPEVGAVVPTQRLIDIESGAVSSALDEGKGPILIKAFASWCGACRRSVWLEDLTDLGETSHLRFVSVSVDESIEQAKEAARDWPIEGPVLFDQSGQFSRDFDVQVLPTYILIDDEGRISRVTSGLPGPLDFRAWKRAAKRD